MWIGGWQSAKGSELAAVGLLGAWQKQLKMGDLWCSLIGNEIDKMMRNKVSSKGRLRLEFPAEAAGHYFPNLYPAGL